MESPTEHLRRILESGERRRKKWECGMCPSCYQKEACPGRMGESGCDNYLPPEPTKSEWPAIYESAYRRIFSDIDATARVYRIGHAKAIRDAMLQIHGFTEKEIEEIESEIENDMHPVP